MKFVLTCEHGGNNIPAEYAYLFKDADRALESHMGYDVGVLSVFHKLRPIADFSIHSEISRLLIELNRSLHHRHLFSSYTWHLDPDIQKKILKEYYTPYRRKVENRIRREISKGEEVLHISVHSFTPEMYGQERRADIGLLYDPARKREKEACKELSTELKEISSGLKVRMNYPYFGIADGFTRYLREQFPGNYIGIEMEVNQKFVVGEQMDPALLKAIRLSVARYLELKNK